MALALTALRGVPNRLAKRKAPSWLPAGIFVLLAVPCFGFTFLFDDFDFLARARHVTLRQLLPDPGSLFYRPLSRESYFALLNLLGPDPIWGHAINAAVVGLTVILMARFVSRIAGERPGLYAGLVLALIGPMPFLVGWISGIQDALAMLFLAAALNCRLQRRERRAVVSCAVALLSKETAVCLVPAIAALPSILDGDHRRTARTLPAYLVLTLAWAGINPGLQRLVAQGPATGAGGYVGFDNTGALENLVQLARAVLNLPQSMEGMRGAASAGRMLALAAIVFLTALAAGARNRRRRAPHAPRPARVLLLGSVMAAVPALATAFWVKHWAPYYACVPGLGVCVVAAIALARVRAPLAAGILAVFLAMGLVCRQSADGGRFLQCESAWGRFSQQMTSVKRGMLSLRPTLPANAILYVSVHVPIERRLHAHLLGYGAPRVWYRRSDIQVRPAGAFDPSAGSFVVFWISPSCEVFEIAYPSLRVRTASRNPDPDDLQSVVRLLALGVFRTGDVERATAMILAMGGRDPETRYFDRRFAAALDLTAGKRLEAARILRGLPPVGRWQAFHDLVALLGPVGSREDFGPAALRAYGMPVDDPEIWRTLMRAFLSAREIEPAWRMAMQVQALRPSDAEAGELVDWIRRIPRPEAVTRHAEALARR